MPTVGEVQCLVRWLPNKINSAEVNGEAKLLTLCHPGAKQEALPEKKGPKATGTIPG